MPATEEHAGHAAPHRRSKFELMQERLLWYGLVLGALCVLASCLPVVPWRFARTDTNVGNRFVTDRYYTLYGATDQFGKTINWFTLKNKMHKKKLDLAKAGPMGAILGSVTAGLGTGGAVMGCSGWQMCKDHVNARYNNYFEVAWCGIWSCVSLVIGCGFTLAAGVFLSQERQGKHGKKEKKKEHKKKKHKDDDDEDVGLCDCGWSLLSAQAKTMVMCIWAFIFQFAGLMAFQIWLDWALKDFKRTAYYPYAMSHVGPYLCGFGCFLMFCSALICINRVTPFRDWCKASEEEEEETPEGQQQPMVGAEGAPPQMEGYPPPNPYQQSYEGQPQPAYGAAPAAAGQTW